MANSPNRWAVRDAAEATFFDIESGNAIVTLQTLKMSEVQTTGETVYARGGRGNAKLVGFSSNREATVTLQDAIFDNLALAALTGNDITTGAKEISKFKVGTLGVGGTIDLGQTPTEIISVHKLDTDNQTNLPAEADVDVSFVDTTVTISSLAEGDMVRVYYKTMTSSDAKTVKVTSDQFGGTFKLVVDVVVRDANTGQDFFGQFIAKRAKMEDEFSFNFSPEGDPSVLDLPIEILKDPESTDMWELVIYDNDAIV